ncbi:MAG: PilZ domain-containing protein [Deltaproteobacteria bacterium]|jgi:hypothetical protein
MTIGKNVVDRRKHKRIRTQRAIFVALRPNYVKTGQVVDLSMAGLAFQYNADSEPPDTSSELDIVSADPDFYLSGMPFQIISDLEMDGVPFRSVRKRRCGLRFGDLTAEQVSNLEFLIENYAEGGGIA